MKKSVIIALCSMLGFTGLITANASACNNEELVKLKKTASKVQANYVEKEEEVDPSTYYAGKENNDPLYENYFSVMFSGLSEKVYVKIDNDYNEETKFIRYQDASSEGIYSFDWKHTDNVVKFTYEVYSSSETSCPDEKLFTGYIILPMYNDFYGTIMCDGLEELEACHKYISKKVDPAKQEEEIMKYLESKIKKEGEKNKKWYQRVGDFVASHKFLTGFSIVVIGGVATTVVVKNKRKRVK